MSHSNRLYRVLREHMLADMPVETILNLLEHYTIEVTPRCIGVDMDHVRSAMEACPI